MADGWQDNGRGLTLQPFRFGRASIGKLASPGNYWSPSDAAATRGRALYRRQALGVMPSLSRPGVSNDKPYSESLFKTLKYRPAYPLKAFDTLLAARTWVGALVRWYNHEHRHSAIRFVTPAQRHANLDQDILERRKALGGYLGDNKQAWRKHDAVALIEDGARFSDFLVDYGDADQFLTTQLRPELLKAACEKANIPLTLRRQAGYDHSYYFISTFMSDHLHWHAARLKA